MCSADRVRVLPFVPTRRRFSPGLPGYHQGVIVAASTVAIVTIAAAVIAVALVLWYISPRGGRRKNPRI